MQKTTFVKTQKSIDGTAYTDTYTGKTLDEESPLGTEFVAKEAPKFFTISSDHYIVFDAAAIQYLSSELTKSDMARVMTMGTMIKGDCSVLYQGNNHAHNPETLSVALELSLDKFYKMVRGLVKKNILSYCVCAPSGFVQKIYMLNPYIARSRKTLSCELHTFFKDITATK